MFINSTITKKNLENIIHETFLKFGISVSSYLLDSLKFLGFYYATNAAISISIEDLKTPINKKDYITIAKNAVLNTSLIWSQGLISDIERFQKIVDSWNEATESLKNKIIDYYKNLDPVNNIFIMAFSGARGNMSQVRQLVGMRGLMSDHEGKIIDLPIITNFREGLSSTDYVTASYGARKGIVDTAFKTADSGYLTRRLIYVAQDLIIRDLDCNNKEGIFILIKKNIQIKNLLGRYLLAIKFLNNPYFNLLKKEIIFKNNLFNKLKLLAPIILTIRSILTCKSKESICQKCYGWNLSQQKLISLGDAVGIIAAQSIGEPGTQLTMRTFHSGGIFTGEEINQFVSPFTGQLILPSLLNTSSTRTSYGISVLKIKTSIILKIINWKGIEVSVFLHEGSYLYINKPCLVKKNTLIAEYTSKNLTKTTKKLKPIYTLFAGEIKFESIRLYQEKRIQFLLENGNVWISKGSLISVPNEIKYNFNNSIKKEVSFLNLKLSISIQSLIKVQNLILDIKFKSKKIFLNCNFLTKNYINYLIKFFPIIKTYQYLDKYTILGFFYFFPLKAQKVLIIKKKYFNNIIKLFFITSLNTWSIYSDQLNYIIQPKFFNKEKTLLYSNVISTIAGTYLRKKGFELQFQYSKPFFLSRGSILKCTKNNFINKNSLFTTLLNFTQETDDIVQDLPKIESLIQAQVSKHTCYLTNFPGILLDSRYFEQFINLKIKLLKNNTLNYVINRSKTHLLKSNFSYKNHYLFTSFLFNKQKILFKNKIFTITYLSSFLNKVSHLITTLFVKKGANNAWVAYKSYDIKNNLFFYKKNKLYNWKKLLIYKSKNKSFNLIYINKNKTFILHTKEHLFIHLKTLFSINIFKLSLNVTFLGSFGTFIDIGEPITAGLLDIHKLLNILFLYHSHLDGLLMGTLKAINKFQIIFLTSIQAIYESQNVCISSKHIEIIIRQMTSKILIKRGGDTPLLEGETISFYLMTEIYSILKRTQYKLPKYTIKLESITVCALKKDGFLSSSGFQETQNILTKAAILGKNDWLRGLKESIITGHLIPTGSTFLNYKNSLNSLYYMK